MSDAYNDERRKLISDKASLEFIPGSVKGFGGEVKLRRQEGSREAVGAMGAGEPTVGRMGEVNGDTVHFDIIDQAGNMISATPSGGWLQSSPVIPELGFCLGSRAQMFWLEENHPASLAPGKRPRTTLSPTMALRDGEPYLSWGSPGGDQQDQWITQFFLRHVHAKMNLQEAIDAPAWHSEHFPISFWPRTSRPGVMVVENRVPKATIENLRERGHLVEVGPDWSEGRLTAASKVGRAPPRRGQPPRHAGLRGRTLRSHDLVDHRQEQCHRPDRNSRRDEILRGRRARASHRARVGGIATQALVNPYYGIDGMKLLRDGRAPARDHRRGSSRQTQDTPADRSTSWTRGAASPPIRAKTASTGAGTSKAKAFRLPATCSPVGGF